MVSTDGPGVEDEEGYLAEVGFAGDEPEVDEPLAGCHAVVGLAWDEPGLDEPLVG